MLTAKQIFYIPFIYFTISILVIIFSIRMKLFKKGGFFYSSKYADNDWIDDFLFGFFWPITFCLGSLILLFWPLIKFYYDTKSKK